MDVHKGLTTLFVSVAVLAALLKASIQKQKKIFAKIPALPRMLAVTAFVWACVDIVP